MASRRRNLAGGRSPSYTWGLNERQTKQLEALRKVKALLQDKSTEKELKRVPVQQFLMECGQELFRGRPLVPCDPLVAGDCPPQELIVDQPYAQTYTVKKIQGQRRVLQCIPPDLVGTGEAAADQALYQRFLRALASIESEGDKYEQLAQWKFGATGDSVPCRSVRTRGECLSLPLSADDDARRCKFEPFVRKNNDPTGTQGFVPFENAGYGDVKLTDFKKTQRESTSENPFNNPRSVDVGTCEPATYTMAHELNKKAKKQRAIDQELALIDKELKRTKYEVVAATDDREALSPNMQRLYDQFAALRRRQTILQVRKTKMDIDIEKQFTDYQKSAANAKIAHELDRLCADRTGSESFISDCQVDAQDFCSVVDPKEGILKQAYDDNNQTTMGSKKCLSTIGEGQTWEWSGKKNAKIVMRDGTTHYGGWRDMNVNDYWNWAWDRLGDAAGKDYRSKDTQKRTQRLNTSLQDLQKQILTLGVRITAANKRDSEKTRLTKERETKLTAYKALVRKAAADSPMIREMIANEIGALNHSDAGIGESAGLLANAAREAGIDMTYYKILPILKMVRALLVKDDGSFTNYGSVHLKDKDVVLMNLRDLRVANIERYGAEQQKCAIIGSPKMVDNDNSVTVKVVATSDPIQNARSAKNLDADFEPSKLYLNQRISKTSDVKKELLAKSKEDNEAKKARIAKIEDKVISAEALVELNKYLDLSENAMDADTAFKQLRKGLLFMQKYDSTAKVSEQFSAEIFAGFRKTLHGILVTAPEIFFDGLNKNQKVTKDSTLRPTTNPSVLRVRDTPATALQEASVREEAEETKMEEYYGEYGYGYGGGASLQSTEVPHHRLAGGGDDLVSLLSTEVPGRPPRIPGIDVEVVGPLAGGGAGGPYAASYRSGAESDLDVDAEMARMYGDGGGGGSEELFDGSSVGELPLTELGSEVYDAATR